MHIDLNSCFATVIQQAYPHLRGKPIAIAAYTTPNGCILAPSIEAKRYGIKTGMTVREGKLLCPDLFVRGSDPVLIRDVHVKFRAICRDYSPDVAPKSIDEIVIDFHGMEHLSLDLVAIGKEIKRRFRAEIGEWISCNVGIAPNRFLAKLAAGLHKPDGLDVIDHTNLISIYSSVCLTDLNGINKKFEARLNASGIFTPLDFLRATEGTLRHDVFKSIVGRHWYFRLRGFEMDDVEFARKSYGQDYALPKHTADSVELSRILMKLCEKMGRRVRRARKEAYGIHLGIIYRDGTFWHRGKKFHTAIYTTQEFFTRATLVLNMQPEKKSVSKLMVSCYALVDSQSAQESLFEDVGKQRRVSDAVDRINDRYGEYVITPALMMDTNDLVPDRISFGAVKELEDLYAAP